MTYHPSAGIMRELVADWARIMRQVRERHIIRTDNNYFVEMA